MAHQPKSLNLSPSKTTKNKTTAAANRIHRYAIQTQWPFQKLTCLFCYSLITPKNNTEFESQSLLSICDECDQSLPRFENYCDTCNIDMPNNDNVCGSCLSSPPSWTRCLAAFRYDTPINALIKQLKFHNKSAYSSQIAKSMVYEFTQRDFNAAKNIDYLIPIPMHPKRLQERGFNQARLIANSLSRITGTKMLDCLTKSHHAPPQSSLAKHARQNNQMQFAIKSLSLLKQLKEKSNVILIDDVLTTGATVENASQYLKKAGISNIEVWVFARTC